METVLMDVFLPAAGRSYEIRAPRAMNSLLAAHLAADAVAELSEGAYLSSKSSIFAWADSGRLLNMANSLEQENVTNGSRLILV